MKLTLILLSLSALQAETFTGVITDTMCGKGHKAMNIVPDEKCVRDCVKLNKSYKYALYDGKNMYKLSDQKLPITGLENR